MAGITLAINIMTIDDNQHTIEEAYTQALVAELISENPGRNVLMYHNKDSQFNSGNIVYRDYVECDIHFHMTQGYEVYVFDTGTFNLAGDGGYINWAFMGNFERQGHFVQFNQISGEYDTEQSLCRLSN
jgi:hypothetical protein